MNISIQRRAMIASGAATFLGIGISSADGAAERPEEQLDIIDCHTHFYDPSRPNGIPWPSKGSPLYRTVLPKHLRAVKQFRRVRGAVIVEASNRVEDNAWLLNLAKADPFIVGVVGNLTPGAAEFPKHLTRFAANPIFRGIRVSSRRIIDLLGKKQLADFHLLAEQDLALDVNGGPDTPAIVASLAAKIPNLRIVQNHIGNVAITTEPPPVKWVQGIQDAAKHRNVYCKISALVEGAARNGRKAPDSMSFYKPYIDVVWNAFGDNRVIYGSNWPVSDRAASYHKLQRIVLEYAFAKGDDATANFCSVNAKRAYKWVERPGRTQRG